MTDLTKDEAIAMAREAGAAPEDGVSGFWVAQTEDLQRFATLCRADLVAENAALKQAHEINADTLNAMQLEIDDWKVRALKAEQVGDRAVPDAEDYDLIDRYLRNNLDDADYGEYLAALDRLVTPQPAAQEPDCATTGVCVRSGLYASPPSAVPVVELPAPTARFNWNLGKFEWLVTFKHSEHHLKPLYTHDRLLQYGAAQRLAGRERAIEECAAECLVLHANGNYKHDTREDCHDAIRALAASPQEQT